MPTVAAAAHVAGDARRICAVGSPIRPRKFRLAVEITRPPDGGSGPEVPQHGPQPVSVSTAPWEARRARVPSASRALRTPGVGGVTTTVTPAATPPPASRTRSASLKSWARPPVQVPRKTQSTGAPAASATGTPRAGSWGMATVGTRADTSIDISPRTVAPESDEKSATGKTPAVAPTSADMFERTMRSSGGRSLAPGPTNSSAAWAAPSEPIRRTISRATSLAPTPAPGLPSSNTLTTSGTRNQTRPLSRAPARSAEPTPVAKAPTAPHITVCESAPTTRSPGDTLLVSRATWKLMPPPTGSSCTPCRLAKSSILAWKPRVVGVEGGA